MPGKSSLGSGKRLPSGGKKGHNEEVKKFLFWPEWTDAELNAEKWDTSGKGKDKGKGGAALYEDLDQPHLPSCLATSIVEWKRPVQFYQKDSQSELSPVVVVPDKVELIDLISCNKHIIISKLICKIISELHLLLRFRKKFRPINLPENDAGAVESWFPWQHIYPWPKGHATPIYNPQGKYCVKIYWMGKWRKITVDDQLPIDSNGHILLPVSTHEGELWPLLITKAILKIINLEGVDGDQYDTNVIQALTGWFGEDVSLSDHDTWSLLQPLLKPWERELINQTKNEHDDDDSSCTIVVAFYYPPKEPIHKNSPCVSMSNQAHPIIMSKWRDEPLELPPLEPPLPPLQSPYYLGLCNRKPRPGYPPPPPPKTDHRSFEIYSPFDSPNNKATLSKTTMSKTTMSKATLSKATLSKTAMSKSDILSVNESTVNIYQSDIWIDLDEFEATFRKIMIFRKPDKFQNIDYDNLSSSSTNSQAPPAGVKKGITLQEEQPVTGDILMIDHCEDVPVKVYINYSSICSWYDGGKQMGLEPVPTLGMRRVQDITNKLDDVIDDYHSTPSVPPGESKETEEVDSNYLLNEGKALSLVPGSLIIQEYTWQYNQGIVYSQNRFNNGLPRIITAGTKTVSLSFPKGRCVLKLLMSAPIGYHVFVYSTVPLIMCKEEELWEHLKKPSRYYLSHGEKIVDLLTDLESDDTINKTIELLSQDTIHRHLTMNDFKALRVSLLRVLHVLGPEIGLDTAQLFAWKTRVLKIMEQINQQRQLSNEEEIVEEQDAVIDMTRMREIDFMLGDKEIKPQDHEKTSSDASGRKSNQVLKKTKNFDGEHELAINDKEEPQLKDHDDDDNNDVIDQLKNSVKCLQDNRKDLGVAIFKCLHAAKPDIITKKGCGFGTTVNNRVFHANYQGTIPYIEPKGWTILFRDVFMVPCKQTIVLKLSSSCKSCIVKTIDNDTSTVVGTDLGPMELNRNEKGYTIIGEVWSFDDTIEGKENWTLSLLSTSPHLPSLMSGKDASIITSFHVIETKKYYLPNRYFVICRYSITVSDDCHVSIQLNTSKSDACFTLEVLDCNQIINTVNGVGHCVIPSLQLCTILEENKGTEQPTINNTHKYIVQATVLYDSWSVGDSAWPYISTIKNAHKEAIQPHKPSSGKKNKGKGGSGSGGGGGGGGTKTPKPSSASHDTVDISKPHWILRIIADSKNSQAIKVEEDKSKEEELKMMQQVWERDQPGRAKKAYKTRQKFLDSHSLPKEEETTTTNNLTCSGGAIDSTNNIPHFGPVPLKPLNHEQYIVSCDECPPRVINYELETDRQSTRLNMVKEYREWRKGVLVKREIEATQRDNNKVKQIELVEDWQLQLDECRNKLNGPRESIRDRNMAKQVAKSPTEDVPAVRPPSKGKDAKGKTAKGKKK